MKCLRCHERTPEHGALCHVCRGELVKSTTAQRAIGNLQVHAEIQAKHATPLIVRKHARAEWREAV